MAETEGPTCTTCLTLNPVGAPACIRCNTPLGQPAAGPHAGREAGPDAGPGGPPRVPAPTDVPGLPPAPGQPPGAASPAVQAQGYAVPAPVGPPTGLAVPPRGTPGGSRSAAAPVQPPGYGLGTGAGPAGPVGVSPAEQRRIRRRIAVVGTLVVLLVLGGGGAALWWLRPRYLDADAVAARIGVELTARLREPVTVHCPAAPRQRTGETFRCTASDGRGMSLQVTVTVLDRAGRYRWVANR